MIVKTNKSLFKIIKKGKERIIDSVCYPNDEYGDLTDNELIAMHEQDIEIMLDINKD